MIATWQKAAASNWSYFHYVINCESCLCSKFFASNFSKPSRPTTVAISSIKFELFLVVVHSSHISLHWFKYGYCFPLIYQSWIHIGYHTEQSVKSLHCAVFTDSVDYWATTSANCTLSDKDETTSFCEVTMSKSGNKAVEYCQTERDNLRTWTINRTTLTHQDI